MQRLKLRAVLRRQLQSVFKAVNRLMLSPMILKYALNIIHPSDQRYIDDKHADTQKSLDQIENYGIMRKRLAQPYDCLLYTSSRS